MKSAVDLCAQTNEKEHSVTMPRSRAVFAEFVSKPSDERSAVEIVDGRNVRFLGLSGMSVALRECHKVPLDSFDSQIDLSSRA